MAHTVLQFIDRTGLDVREAPVGISWTTLFFGPMPMLYRRDWQWFIICAIFWCLTGGLSNLVFMFTINRTYIRHLIAQGYRVKASSDVPHEVGYLEKLSAELKTDLPTSKYESY